MSSVEEKENGASDNKEEDNYDDDENDKESSGDLDLDVWQSYNIADSSSSKKRKRHDLSAADRSSTSSSSSSSSTTTTSSSSSKKKKQNKSVSASSTPSARKGMKTFAAFTEETAIKAELLLHDIMPNKILQLHHLSKNLAPFYHSVENNSSSDNSNNNNNNQSDNNNNSNSTSSNVKINSKKNIHVPLNSSLVDQLPIIKKEILEIIDILGSIKIYIQLNIPKIEDGNNFGVGIQEEAVAELTKAEDSSFSVLESMTKYFITRGRLVSKLTKYPQIEDYKQSIRELDEKEYLHMKLSCIDLRNSYAILHDMLTKNEEKIKAPRGAPNDTSLMSMF